MESDVEEPRKCVRLIPQEFLEEAIKNMSSPQRSSAVQDALETILEEEQAAGSVADFFASMSEYGADFFASCEREVCELRAGEARRQGVAILSMAEAATSFHADTSMEAFALSVSLLQHCITTRKLSIEQRESLELPLVCFLIATKYADGAPPLLCHLCSCIPGVDINQRAVSDLELVVLKALNWTIAV